MKHCLVIDDSRVAILEIQYTIKHFYPDCKFSSSQNPFKGIALAEEYGEELDCIIVDYNMEGLNGLETVQAISQFYDPSRIAICSGNVQKIVKDKVAQLGVTFIEKRFDNEKFATFEKSIRNQ